MDNHSVKEGQARFELMDSQVKIESSASSPRFPPSELPSPLPTTETPDAPVSASPRPSETPNMPRKKGTATGVSRVPKRKAGPMATRPKKPKSQTTVANAPDSASEGDEEGDESDNGPYCLCRGPDDHRWMICCERCEDWFHGECINIDKSIGEALIERFICPICTRGNLVTIYKKTCALGACKKPARLAQDPASFFCSAEHTQSWWERMMGRLQKERSRVGLDDQLVQEEMMALLSSHLGGLDERGLWKLARAPFSQQPLKTDPEDNVAPSYELGEEETAFLEGAERTRFQLAEETLLSHKMQSLLEFAQERRRAAITSGRLQEDMCGYDGRLDTILARDAFSAFIKSSEGEAIFQAGQLGDPLGEGDEARGMCGRKRCRTHKDWHKTLVSGVKHQMREMAGHAAEVADEERILKEAAEERGKRRQAENNRVEVLS